MTGMKRMKVVRDERGEIINIGEWDYGEHRNEETKELIIRYPTPKGAYEDEADIVIGWDGGLYEAADPRRLKPA